MRRLRNLCCVAVLSFPFLLPATSMAGNLSGCDTGPAPTLDPTNSPRTKICSDDNTNYGYCCKSGQRWDLKCVEQADAAYPATATVCGRDAWTAIQIPNTQQYFPRDFNVVALDGYIMGIVDVDDPIAASDWVTAKYFSLNKLQREPWAVIANAVSLCSGTVSGNVSHSSAANSYNDKCVLGNITYNPTTFTHQGNIANLLDFSVAKSKMWNMSVALRDYENQITVTKSSTNDTTLTFTGTDPEINVFNVDAQWLNGTYSYVFNLPKPTPPAAPASVIVNIIPDKASASGTTSLPISISSAGISSLIGGQSGGMAPGNLLWNIPPALGSTAIMSSLRISSTGFVGTLLAPNTTVNLTSTNVRGTIVASSVQLISSEPHSAPYHVPSSQLALAKQYIKHVVVIMQENRSFDNYFGTFTGANGIPTSGQDATNAKASCDLSKDSTGKSKCACKVDVNGTYVPYHNTNTVEPNFPHYYSDFTAQPGDPDQQRDANKPAAGQALEAANFLHTACVPGQGDGNHNTQADLIQALGYHTDAEIPNYWNLAKSFVLQDRMFAAAPSWSPVEHTFMVSGWNASGCDTTAGCVEQVDNTYADANNHFLWNDITNLLVKDNVSWRFYLGENWLPSCKTAVTSPKDCFNASDKIAGFWNPYNQGGDSFQTVIDNQQTGNVMNLRDFFVQAESSDTTDGASFPQVSWIVPGFNVSEHAAGTYPNNSINIKDGHAYVGSVITAIMKHRALWETTAIFLSWDDWGGFYDHVQPSYPDPKSKFTYGFRVPGLLITPWVKAGTIDSQTLSHDAYLKLMEDVFLGKKRIGPSTGKVATKDNRTPTQQRDNAANLGDLVTEFDFSHTPLAPISLQCINP